MAKYTLKRSDKHGGKVEVRTQHVEFHVPAFIICALLAFVIWLYIVGISQIPIQLAPPSDTSAPETGASTVAPAEPTEKVCLPVPVYSRIEGADAFWMR